MKKLLSILISATLCFGQTAVIRVGAGPLASSGTNTFGIVPLQVCHAQYSFALDGGAIGLITPVNNCTIPALSSVYLVSIRWTTAGAGLTNTTSIGLTGTGGGAAVLLSTTAVASLTGQVASTVTPATPATWIRITTSGTVTLTPAVAPLTAGVCEIYIFYFTSST